MRKNDSFRNSELDRVKPPKRRLFYSFVNDKLKRHRSDTGLVEDRTSSVTIVRIIVGLLMIHLIIIGGVLLRGQMLKDGSSIVTPVSITPPPAPAASQQAESSQDVLPQPVTANTAAKSTSQANHITQTGTLGEDVAVDPDDEPVIITPPPAQAEPIHHRVAPGDSWVRIASQYGTTEAALKAANPQMARGVLRAGASLVIPQPGATPATAAAPAQPSAQEAAANSASETRTYVVKSRETLSGIAKKEKVDLQELIRINDIKDPKRIRPGMQLRLPR